MEVISPKKKFSKISRKEKVDKLIQGNFLKII